MVERTSEQIPRGGWRPGFYVKPKHIGLVFSVSLVGCMVAFGAGFIVGMGYKASEQVSPYAVKKPLAIESTEQPKVSSVETLVFIDRLIKNEPVKMNPLTETTQEPERPPAVPTPGPTPARQGHSVVAEETATQSIDQQTAVGTAQAQTVVAGETGLDPQALEPADVSSLGTDEAVVATYSVQVASFLAQERAQRLIQELTEKGYHAYVHPFEVPGQPLWYRVKVGKFADRATANLALEKLWIEELGTPDAMITRD